MIILQESKEIQELNEMFVHVFDGLDPKIENSVYYPRIKHLLFAEIQGFAREKVELKRDLHSLRLNVGQQLNEEEIRKYLDNIKDTYNNKDSDIGIDYHIETTRIDYGVPVFVMIKRDVIYIKKFVFRFKKKDLSSGIGGLTQTGINLESKDERKERYSKLIDKL